MTETFVDLTYRGLSLGRRIKLAQIHPTTGYLEHPTPMPVGTSVSISTDEGVTLDAVVIRIHEQVGGSETPPGMSIRPALATEQIATWWNARATPEPAPPVATPAAPERGKPITVRPRTHTTPEPLPNAPTAVATLAATGTPVSPANMAIPDGPTTIPGTIFNPVAADPPATGIPPGIAFNPAGATRVMPAVDQELLAQLTKNDDIEQLTRTTGEHPVVDDGMRTMVMDAVDPAALGLDVSMLSSSSGSLPAVDDENGDDDDSPPSGPTTDDKKPAVKKKKRKRR
jgi:hypothetical protein